MGKVNASNIVANDCYQNPKKDVENSNIIITLKGDKRMEKKNQSTLNL
ncbi:hypothetical protein ACFFH4_16035 [Halalkalibacter alkalisediminis]|uniref:Uncharacterized protein n=1 Tax=Halalkalibacter alkalisediminis TaxID=935616 RepID=A0ABV6NIB9_9BACI